MFFEECIVKEVDGGGYFVFVYGPKGNGGGAFGGNGGGSGGGSDSCGGGGGCFHWVSIGPEEYLN